MSSPHTDDWTEELGIIALALGTAIGMCRVFDAWAWLVPLGVAVVLGELSSAVLRRLGLATIPATLVQLAIGFVVVVRIGAGGANVALFVPTPAAVAHLGDEIGVAFGRVAEMVAPVEAVPGFTAIVAAGIWVLVGFADTAAIRYRAPIQAAVPFVAVFAAVGVLARDHGRLISAFAFAAGLGGFAVAQCWRRANEDRWLGRTRTRGSIAATRGALGVLGVAAVAMIVAVPFVPDADPVINLREIGKGPGPRTVVSPFVGIRSLLGERSDEVMFEVAADEGAYWRLTALERFDFERDIWVSRVRYADVGDELPQPAQSPPGLPLAQRYEIAGLSGLWLPAAFRPTQTDSERPLSFDVGTASLILRAGEPSPGLVYDVVSEVPDIDDLGSAQRSPGPSEDYLEVPQLSPAARDAVDRFRSIDSPGEQMLELQNWLREFDYDDTVDFSGAADPIGAFLAEGRGFCQQFASTFAIFARELGVPSRVAVGFTEGEPDGDGTFVVRGRNAHAWPEVYLDDLGWVPFEPTPQRGNPQAEQYTGVEPQQAPAPDPSTNPTVTSTPAAEQASTTTAPGPTTTSPEVDSAAPRPPSRRDGASGPPVVWILAAVIVVSGAALWWRRTRRGSSHDFSADTPIAGTWRRAVAAVGPLGLVPGVAETPMEFAARCDDLLGNDAFGRLAELETRRRFAPGAPTDSSELVTLLEQVHDGVRRHTGESVGAGSL